MLGGIRRATIRPYTAGIDFRRQNLTSVEILTSKVDPRTVRVKYFQCP